MSFSKQGCRVIHLGAAVNGTEWWRGEISQHELLDVGRLLGNANEAITRPCTLRHFEWRAKAR